MDTIEILNIIQVLKYYFYTFILIFINLVRFNWLIDFSQPRNEAIIILSAISAPERSSRPENLQLKFK
jgi:hypothetical protein